MKHILAVFFLSINQLYGQSAVASAVQVKEGKGYHYNYSGFDSSGYYCFSYGTGVTYAKKLNKEMQPVICLAVPQMTYENRPKIYFDSRLIGNTLWLFTLGWEPASRSYVLFAQSFNRSTMKPIAKAFEIDRQADGALLPEMTKSGFHLIYPEDRKGVCVFSSRIDNGLLVCSIKMFDVNMCLLWEKKYNSPFNVSKLKSWQICAGTSTEFCLLANEITDSTLLTAHLIIISGNNTNRDFTIHVPGYKIKEIDMHAARTGTIAIGGTVYRDHKDAINGTFIFKLNSSAGQPQVIYNPFDTVFYSTYGNGISGKHGIRDLFNLKSVQCTPDSGVIISLENSWKQTEMEWVSETDRTIIITEGETTITKTNYESYEPVETIYIGDILVFKFNKKGEQVWSRFISKRQCYDKGQSSMGMSFDFLYRENGTMLVLFNNHFSHTTKFPEDLPPGFREPYLYPEPEIYSIDTAGLVSIIDMSMCFEKPIRFKIGYFQEGINKKIIGYSEEMKGLSLQGNYCEIRLD
jgi:hypothetical protein